MLFADQVGMSVTPSKVRPGVGWLRMTTDSAQHKARPVRNIVLHYFSYSIFLNLWRISRISTTSGKKSHSAH